MFLSPVRNEFNLPNGFVKPDFYCRLKKWILESLFCDDDWSISYENKLCIMIEELDLHYSLIEDIMVFYCPEDDTDDKLWNVLTPTIIEYCSIAGMIKELLKDAPPRRRYDMNLFNFLVAFLTDWNTLRIYLSDYDDIVIPSY
jgi:hypothetical protein